MCAFAAISGLTGKICPSAGWVSDMSRFPSFRLLAAVQPGILGHKYGAVLDLDHNRLQPLAETRAAQALPVGDAEFGAMGGADDKAAVVGEEAVRRPLQRRAEMRARVHIHEDVVALPDGDQAGEAAGWRRESLGDAAWQIIAAAERTERRHVFAQRFHPPIRQIWSQCAFDTGETDSRDCRTSARSASPGSALIATSVTGFGIGRTAFMSTATQSPFSAVGSGYASRTTFTTPTISLPSLEW